MITTFARRASFSRLQLFALTPLISPLFNWCAASLALESPLLYRPGAIEMTAVGTVLSNIGQPAMAIPWYRAALWFYNSKEWHDALVADINIKLACAIDDASPSEHSGDLYNLGILAKSSIYGEESARTINAQLAYGEYLRSKGYSQAALIRLFKSESGVSTEPATVEKLNRARLIALLQTDLSQFSEANSTHTQAISSARSIFGPDHIFIATEIIALASTGGALCDANENQQAAAIIQREIDYNRDKTGAYRHNLGVYYRYINECDKAIPLLQAALEIESKIPKLATDSHRTLYHLANCYKSLGNLKKAKTITQQLLTALEGNCDTGNLDAAKLLMTELLTAEGLANPGAGWTSRKHYILRFPTAERAFN